MWFASIIRMLIGLFIAILPAITLALSPLTKQSQKSIPLTLKDAIFLALRYNPNIRNNEIGRIVQKFSVRVAENAFELNYALNGTANITKQSANGEPPTVNQNYSLTPSASLLLPTGTRFNLSMQNNSAGNYYNPGVTLSVDQPLLKGSNPQVVLAPLYNTYDQEWINRIQLRSNVINTIVQVINNYRSVINAQQSLIIDRQSLARAEQNYRNTQKFIEAGQKPRMDLAQAKLTVTQNQLTILTDKNNVDQTRQTLLLSLGLDPSMKINILNQVNVHKYRLPSIKTATALALKNSPTYQTNLINLRIARRTLLTAKDNARWSLDAKFTASWGNGSGGPPNNNLQSIINGANNLQSGSLVLNIPINNVNDQQAILSAEVNLRQQEISTAFEKDQVRTNVINQMRQIRIDYLRLQSAIQAAHLQKINLANANKQYQAGQLDSLSVSQQQNTLTQAEQTVLSNQITYLNDITAFRQLLQQTLHYWKIKLQY